MSWLRKLLPVWLITWFKLHFSNFEPKEKMIPNSDAIPEQYIDNSRVAIPMSRAQKKELTKTGIMRKPSTAEILEARENWVKENYPNLLPYQRPPRTLHLATDGSKYYYRVSKNKRS